MYIQPVIELSEDIYNHQISLEEFNIIYKNIENIEVKILFIKRYYVNNIIKEYIFNPQLKQKEDNIIKEKVLDYKILNDKYMYFNKTYKYLEQGDFIISDLNYVESYYLLIFNNLHFIFILSNPNNILNNMNSVDSFINNIEEFSSISYKLYFESIEQIPEMCEYLDKLRAAPSQEPPGPRA